MSELQANDFDLEVFFDGACPLCRGEMNLLQRWDRKGRVRFTDIAATDFDPASIGKSHAELMTQIYGRLPDGSLIRGVEVFRRLYTAVGFGPLVSVTRLPVISQLLDCGYWLFAKNRLRLTGRCESGACAIPAVKHGKNPS
jgi:predicted DCC family thiol-disulfide oxidoreductase YuxK